MRLVHASISENGTDGWDGKAKAGDQTGKEVCVRSWYNKGWAYLLRYKDPEIAKKASEIAVRIAASNLVGYDQSERMTLFRALDDLGWDYEKYLKSGILTECDCSSFVHAIYSIVVPEIRIWKPSPITVEMAGTYQFWGFECFTDTKYLNRATYLLPGDLLVKPGSHTAMVCAGDDEIETCSPTVPVIKYGMRGNVVKSIQTLLELCGYDCGACGPDGIFGGDTLKAVKRFQENHGLAADGEIGKNTYTKLFAL